MSTPNPQLVAVMGRGIVDQDTALLTADNLGLTRGDGCFDATRLVVDGAGKRVDNIERHLRRFARSWELLELGRLGFEAWRALIDEAVDAWDVPGAATVKTIATRGTEHPQSEPTQLLTITPFSGSLVPLNVVTLNRGYTSDAFAESPWLLGGVKSLSYAINVAGTREAHRRGADNCLFVSADGFCLEGPTSALVVATGDEVVLTPLEGTGILRSITADVVTEQLEAEGVRVVHRLIRPAEILDADGAWLMSSVRGVCPIVTLDGHDVPQDAARTRHYTALSGFDR